MKLIINEAYEYSLRQCNETMRKDRDLGIIREFSANLDVPLDSLEQLFDLEVISKLEVYDGEQEAFSSERYKEIINASANIGESKGSFLVLR